ncbi:MAG: cupin domain-containing protein [Paludibacter sp.]|nr:cupin domain-containing protein [Paludibacter sp.]
MKKIKFLFLLFSLCGLISAQTKDSTQTKWTIKNCVNQFSADKTVPTKAGYQYWFADKDFLNGRTLKMSVVKPHDATHPPHKHAEDEFFFILEGKAQFYLNGDSVIAEPYASFYCPSMVEHGISNVGDTELKYLVIKDYGAQK